MSLLFTSTRTFFIEFLLFFIIYGGITAFIQYHFLIKFIQINVVKKRYFIIFLLIYYTLSALFLKFNIQGLLYRITYFIVLFCFSYILLMKKQAGISISLMASMLSITVLTLSEGFSGPIGYLLINSLLPLHNDFFFILSNLLYNGFIFFLIHSVFQMICKWFRFKSTEVTHYLFVLFIPLTLLILVSQIIFDAGYGTMMVIKNNKAVSIFNHYQTLFIFSLALVCLFTILFSFRKLTQQIEQELYYNEINQRYELTRSFRHDLNNHMVVLRGLLERDKTNEAAKYLQNLETESHQLTYYSETGNIAVDALFADKLTCAKQKGIELILDIDIPNNLEISDFDLCIIFSNAIDNAINACKLIKAAPKWIDIKVKQNHDFLLIDIINSCDIGKKTKKGSGIGLLNMSRTCNKWGGTMQIETKKDTFICTVLLPLTKKIFPSA